MIRLSEAQLETALAQCASEPIRIPGSIQPHGVLLTLIGPALTINQISSNCVSMFGQSVAALLQQPLTTLTGAAVAEQVHHALSLKDLEDANPLVLEIDARRWHGSLSRHDAVIILELEPLLEPVQDNTAILLRTLRRMQAATTLQDLYAVSVEEIRHLTGFDRVMIYRFEPQGHGQVIGEALGGQLPGYLGQCFPASDIPLQARELYRLNWIRVIPDARYVPVPILPVLRPDTGQALDLGFSMLRSVSPVHCQYLENMGVRASMSLSLLENDQLWGLITCAHPESLLVSHPVRTMCAAIAQLLSVQITALHTRDRQAEREEKSQLISELALAMRVAEKDVLVGLVDHSKQLLAVTGATGVAVLIEDRLQLIGECPTQEQVRALYLWVREQCLESGELLLTDHLQGLHGVSALYSDVASGLLAFVLPKPVDNAVMWFGAQLRSSMRWSGNPDEHFSAPGDASNRLQPRKSFAAWEQQVEGRSRTWSAADAYAAKELRRSAIEGDLDRQVRREHEAVRVRDELVAVVSHDLRNPMTIIIMQCGMMQRLVSRDEGKNSPRLSAALGTMEEASARMNTLIADLLDKSKLDAGHYPLDCKPLDIVELLEQTCALLVTLTSHKDIALSCTSAAGLCIDADPQRLFQVLSNLLGNAIKFTPPGGCIDLNAWQVDDKVLISVRDNGSGIHAAQLPHIFERYWSVREGNPNGSGLGLYICRSIVQAHGGELWADSEPGVGSVFTFSIPAFVGGAVKT
ncbi:MULTISPECIES: ATP-binding protein [unclassified Pseudomonas]|uniref:ATP-binding protein n=1 Tax=unclassified Pseudomonas TaxID=196821 RepID=UPI002AC8B91A|nr:MULTISPECIES: ATP-binding protein [unclassified Pseudomonas]MEB0048549.1 ATP-binding protein [Pseudomonas sp. Dout3]MEB0099412.1 ATP-binding protein [Pseudomonas sp. DC1.2]WPX57171.1 ATP-binding protein [Pseudomonas sp. DC1.2]